MSGTDRSAFTIGGGTLAFKVTHKPNFENRSSYSITIRATSGGLSTTLDVTVEVEDTDDPGTVALSQRQPEVGIAILATATDADGGVIVRRWVWERSDPITVDWGRAVGRVRGRH